MSLKKGAPIGGMRPIPVKDEDVQQVAQFALRAINEQNNVRAELLEITEAWVQVVAGLKYLLKMRLNPGGLVQAEVLEPPSGRGNPEYRALNIAREDGSHQDLTLNTTRVR
jgi:hypothetical protein